jgi:hypothetical protein
MEVGSGVVRGLVGFGGVVGAASQDCRRRMGQQSRRIKPSTLIHHATK